jgi:hypothetical protein
MTTTETQKRVCPHCGAGADGIWTSCWMCGLDLPEEMPAGAPRRSGESAFPPGVVAFVPWLLAGLVGLMLLGLCIDGNWGAAIGFLLLLTPAGVYTFVKSRSRQGTDAPMSGASKFATFLVSLAVTVGCVFAVGLAAFIALFVICIVSLSNANFH